MAAFRRGVWAARALPLVPAACASIAWAVKPAEVRAPASSGMPAGVVACEAGADDTAGYEARIVAGTSHARLFDRLASVRDWDGRPTSLTRSDFVRARLFCHMLPSGSLSAVPDATGPGMSESSRAALSQIGDSEGRVSWTEYLVLSALLAMTPRELELVLAAGDGDGSGLLSHEELSRALGLVVGDELRASALPPTAAASWPHVRPGADDPASALGDRAGESGTADRQLWRLEPPSSVARACLAPGAAPLPPNAGRKALDADRYDPARLAALVNGLAAAVCELEFRVFADAERSAAVPGAAGGPAAASGVPVMTAGGFARYMVCQSMSGPGETARLLERWEARLAGASEAGAGRRAGGASPFRSTSDADVLDGSAFAAARGALVGRSDDVIASLRFLVGGPEGRVGPRELSHAVWATSGAELPRLASEALLAVSSAAEGRDASVATASLAEVGALLGSHAGTSVGRSRTDRGGLAACLRGGP